MEPKKLTDDEREKLEQLIAHDDAEALSLLDDSQRCLLIDFIHAALRDDFISMIELISADRPAFEDMYSHETPSAAIRRLLEHAAACGDADCACELGAVYYRGVGIVEQDYERARDLYAWGKRLGSMQASVNLGYLYYFGRVGAVDYAAAYECFALAACVEGNPEGLWKLGDMYAHGQFVAKSEITAFELYKRAYTACEGSSARARPAHHIADMLLDGIEGWAQPDPKQALVFYQDAELAYYDEIAQGLTYYRKALGQAIEGQNRARRAMAQGA